MGRAELPANRDLPTEAMRDAEGARTWVGQSLVAHPVRLLAVRAHRRRGRCVLDSVACRALQRSVAHPLLRRPSGGGLVERFEQALSALLAESRESGDVAWARLPHALHAAERLQQRASL